jgi:hypothetical protein
MQLALLQGNVDEFKRDIVQEASTTDSPHRLKSYKEEILDE